MRNDPMKDAFDHKTVTNEFDVHLRALREEMGEIVGDVAEYDAGFEVNAQYLYNDLHEVMKRQKAIIAMLEDGRAWVSSE